MNKIDKCKYCGSINLILEPRVKGEDVMTAQIVALKCAECDKWLKWCPKEERELYLKKEQNDRDINCSDNLDETKTNLLQDRNTDETGTNGVWDWAGDLLSEIADPDDVWQTKIYKNLQNFKKEILKELEIKLNREIKKI